MPNIIWAKTTDGYNGFANGNSDVDNPDYFICRVSGRMRLYVAGNDDHVGTGTLAACQAKAESLLADAQDGTDKKPITADELNIIAAPAPTQVEVSVTVDSPEQAVAAAEALASFPGMTVDSVSARPAADAPTLDQVDWANNLGRLAADAIDAAMEAAEENADDPFGAAEETTEEVDVPINKVELSWPKDGVTEDWHGTPALRFTTVCGRYRVTRIYHRALERYAYGAEAWDRTKFVTFEHDEKLGAAYPKWHRSLRTAIESCEADLTAENNAPVVSNREAVLMAYAEPAAAAPDAPAKPARGRAAPVTADDVPEADKPARPVAAPKAPKAPKPASTGDGKDRFGCRLGTNAALNNSVITGTPKTAEQIEKESGASNTRNHLKAMVAKGLIAKNEQGYYDPKMV